MQKRKSFSARLWRC